MSRLSTKQRRAARRRRAAYWDRVFKRLCPSGYSLLGVDRATQRDETVGMLVEFGEVTVVAIDEAHLIGPDLVEKLTEMMREQDEPPRPVPVGRCPRCGVLWFTNTGFCGGCRT